MLKHHSRFLAAVAAASLFAGAATALSPIDDRTTKTLDPDTGKTIVVTEPELDRAGGDWVFGTSTDEPLTLH